jgi:uncharacterized protein (TIGR03083 family)
MVGMPLDPMTHVAAFRAEAERCGALARVVPHAAPLPHVPRWSVGGVVRHLVGDFRWACDIVETCQWNGNGFSVPRTRGDGLLRAYDEAAARMGVALAAAAATPATPCPNFAERDEGTLGWWPRHQAHETLLHRWDMESATGRHDAIDPAVAADGVDEAFRVYTARYGPQRLDRPITIVCADADAAWTVSPTGTDGRVAVAPTTHRSGADLECTASALLLAIWKREPLTSDTARFADEAVVRRFLSGPLTA